MLKLITKQSWICPTCRLHHRRFKQIAATTRSAPNDRAAYSPIKAPPLVDHSTPGAQADDHNLRLIFDSQSFWREFSQSALGHTRSTGLFQNRYLTSQHGFQTFAEVTLGKAQRLVPKILEISHVGGYIKIVRYLDRLSDYLCRVIDLCDFVRATHPDLHMQEAASSAHAMMFQYMNVLNTTTGLYDQLKKASEMPEVVKEWTHEEKITAQILLKDFSKSAIQLPTAERHKFVDLSDEINRLGSEFVDNMAPEKSHLCFDGGSLKGMDPEIAAQLRRWNKFVVPTYGSATTMALRTVQDESVRREIYVASRRVGRQQLDRLEKLLKLRAEVARLSGFASFAHMALGDKMAQSPESVDKFLRALLKKNKGRAQAEYNELLQLKQRTSGATATQLNAWDRDYYMSQQMMQMRTGVRRPDNLSAYFSLGTVMQGLSRLFTRLYGLRLVPRQTMVGETWNDEVRRLDVFDESEGHVAVMYCDFFERISKNPNPAHFTLRCSRRIYSEDDDDNDDDFDAPAADERIAPLLRGDTTDTDGMASSRNSQNELYQLPTIALICDFSRPSNSNEPTLLSFRQVQTLFHEMGHALHSMLGRTSLQNVSGTRCATDFAELPSVLMEHFATAPEVLGLFARHWRTDQPLPYELLRDKIALDRRSEAADTETQILLAMLDQAYHSPLAHSASFNTTQIYHHILATHATFPADPPETSWHGLFGHLFGYAATYYAYLFDRAIAGKIWHQVFQAPSSSSSSDHNHHHHHNNAGPLSPTAGRRFRNDVLRWGGSRDGWLCVAALLQDDSLAVGGERAMAMVGEWGVQD